MSLSAFLAQNAAPIENEQYAVSDRFQEDGEPVKWEIRSITSAQDEELRKSCVKTVPVKGKRGQYTQETDNNKYLGLLAAECVVYPNLNAAELQDSYGVKGADALLKAMLTAGEYVSLLEKVQEVNGFDKTFMDEVDEAKNS